MSKLFANSGDPDQTPRSVASDLGLHCLPVTLLRVSRLQWVKDPAHVKTYNETCVTSKDSNQLVDPPSTARVPVYPSLDSSGAVEGTHDQQGL